MGKLQSKPACKRRENPEGDVFKEADCTGEVDRNKQNMLSLMQTICEVVEASVKQLVLSNATTLHVKLSVTSLTGRKGNRKDRDAGMSQNERGQMEDVVRCAESLHSQIRQLNSDHLGVSERKHYSVDENTERRNHYLDLAGIENYTSQFEAPETCAEEQPQDGSSCNHHRRSQPETCSPVESSGKSIPFLRSLRNHSKSVRYSGASTKPSKLHGHHPMTWCHPSQQQQQQPLLYSSSKRTRARARAQK
ncbi:protein naked cuticle homolog 2-like [Sinocyclocheilus rhinocerous]|uniref:protein naked cuticle homolog 2-like n=1 Tax=Sinocyclocheilus rhinocerous TaxID=307959 RepID=UPI0007B81E2A|nr:PREDICTED: protein naked cuticle homolog 2-like [Sinocyclocheilus rhinocerous]